MILHGCRRRSALNVRYLQHEGKVQILGPIPDVDVSMVRCQWHVKGGHAEPQQATNDTDTTSALKLKAPTSYTQRQKWNLALCNCLGDLTESNGLRYNSEVLSRGLHDCLLLA